MKLIKTLTYAGYAFAVAGCLAAAAAAAAASHKITQSGKAFSVKKLEVAVGDTIVFMNDDSVKHNILVKDIKFNSGMQEPGTEATATFDQAGKFTVRCGIHPKMKMKVVAK